MSKRGLVIVLVAVLVIGAFGAWEASAQDPGDDDTPPCGEFYGHGMMRGHMMDGWNAPEDCPFADGTWTGPGMMGGWTGRGPMHGRGGMMGGWNMAKDFPFADSVELTLSEDEALAAAQTYLDENYPGLTLDENVATFNGYYMLYILEDGQFVGMLSINGETGEVWLHHRPWSADALDG